MKPELTPDQKAVLDAFKERHGRHWKETLNVLWQTGQDVNKPNGALLRQIRNQLGPTWLKGYQP